MKEIGISIRPGIYVVVADTYALVDLVRFMQETGLLDTGDYVVISLEAQEFYDPTKEYQYIRRDFEASWMVADPIPFRSVLLLSPGSPINPDYDYFQDLVRNYSGSEPFNIPFHPFIKVEVPIYAGLAFDAVMIYASALTDALANNVSARDGPGVFQYIKSRNYESILGFSMMIDDRGDAEGNYTVMALLETANSTRSRMRPVARFTHQGSNDLPEMMKIEIIVVLSQKILLLRIKSSRAWPKGNTVHIYHVTRKHRFDKKIRKKKLQIREMRHENINPFIGAGVDPPNICILTLYCARGSLQDVLKNTDIHLDMMFIASLVMDLVKGMIYIHESDIVSHGNLKSSNCIVDSRWMLKITDFGLHEFRANQDPPPEVQEIRSKSLLWRAPELLRDLNPPPRGTQKGDVYSFGIILFEIMGRRGPWGKPEPSVKYVTERVANPKHYDGIYYRPPSDELECPDYIRNCMEECWHEDPEDRPDFRLIKVKLRILYSGLHSNIFDNMISIMEKYAYNLEAVVKDRTKKLQEEKKKTENLLLRMLPKPVAEQLLRGEKVEAESFDSVTIYFSDIVGFTSLSAVSTPLQVVDLLNDLYTCFDSIIGNYDVYKVETIGDAYMVVSGLPIRNGDRHAGEIASLALRLREALETFEIRHRPNERLSLRIGINTGPCVAGVVGLKMPRYCLFGDTVNTASRMESTGEAMKIHVSEACKQVLDKLGGYVLQERGLIPIKGKGEMRTFWLLGKEVMDCESLPLGKTSPILRPPSHFDLRHPLPDLLSGGENTVLPPNVNDSCVSLFNDCKRSAENHVRRANGYRSAPTINFRQFYSPEDLLF
ncbi:guanylate cyclase 32E [Nephila pilipes]|uniref:Guanylate cyclase n=1 Tax=Nephila pilipes TaxID=299642 RepID=A0A8X6PI11_NEPPI|nr:guanylate cyclase 32E [Nephila pilipes]